MVDTEKWWIRTESKSFFKRLVGEKDSIINHSEIDKRNAELKEQLAKNTRELVDGFCPFTNLGNCRPDCVNFSLGRVKEAGEKNSYGGKWVYVGSIVETKCKLWNNQI